VAGVRRDQADRRRHRALPAGRVRRGVVPGLAFTFITRPFYPYYVDTPRLWGLSPSEDQNLGGVIMNAEQAIVFLSALVFAIAALLDRQDRETAGYRD
jgi:cytochrome c oxidase assembly factor CtaG